MSDKKDKKTKEVKDTSEQIENKTDPKDEEIVTLKQKISELDNSWKRALADYQNLQKRFVEEKEHIVRFANSTLILKLLTVLDNLELMSKHSDDKGLELVVGEFRKTLVEEGLEEIDAFEKEFDSSTMEALELVEGDQNKVVEVVKKGYMYKSKLLRPALVKVGKGR